MVKPILSAFLLLGLVNTGLCCLPLGAVGKKVKSIFVKEVKVAKIVSQGCYIARDPKENEDTIGSLTTIDDISWQKCRDHCFGKKQPGDKDKVGMKQVTCWCNFEYKKVDQTDDSRCDQKCAGNDREWCGGRDYVSVYSPSLDVNG